MFFSHNILLPHYIKWEARWMPTHILVHDRYILAFYSYIYFLFGFLFTVFGLLLNRLSSFDQKYLLEKS